MLASSELGITSQALASPTMLALQRELAIQRELALRKMPALPMTMRQSTCRLGHAKPRRDLEGERVSRRRCGALKHHRKVAGKVHG
jgi:hypothetical protein